MSLLYQCLTLWGGRIISITLSTTLWAKTTMPTMMSTMRATTRHAHAHSIAHSIAHSHTITVSFQHPIRLFRQPLTCRVRCFQLIYGDAQCSGNGRLHFLMLHQRANTAQPFTAEDGIRL